MVYVCFIALYLIDSCKFATNAYKLQLMYINLYNFLMNGL